MRDIKFRAWDKAKKEWVHKQACNILGETILLHGWMQRPNGKHVKVEELNNIEVIQYTGLKDKNGVEIYEGDIVDTGFNKAIIDYNEDTARFCFRRLQHRIKWIEHITIINCYEVIGNIYENSDLLENR